MFLKLFLGKVLVDMSRHVAGGKASQEGRGDGPGEHWGRVLAKLKGSLGGKVDVSAQCNQAVTGDRGCVPGSLVLSRVPRTFRQLS